MVVKYKLTKSRKHLKTFHVAKEFSACLAQSHFICLRLETWFVFTYNTAYKSLNVSWQICSYMCSFISKSMPYMIAIDFFTTFELLKYSGI